MRLCIPGFKVVRKLNVADLDLDHLFELLVIFAWRPDHQDVRHLLVIRIGNEELKFDRHLIRFGFQ